MELGRITAQQLPLFKSLLLPKAAAAIENEEPIAAIGLTEQHTACGAAAGYIENGSFELLSLYVAPDFRRRGGGRMLVEKLEALLADMPDVWKIRISFYETEPEHETLAPFLEALSFRKEQEREENLFFARLSDAAASPFFRADDPIDSEVMPFSKIPDIYLSRADKQARMADAPMPENPLHSPQLDREVSCALVRDNTVKAFAAFDRSCAGRLTLCSAWSGSSQGAMAALLRHAFKRAGEIYPPETPLAIQAVTPASAGLIRALLPPARPVSFSYYRSINEF